MISSDARTARERLLAAASELIDTLAQQGITQFSSHEQAALSPPPDPTRDTAPSIGGCRTKLAHRILFVARA